MSHFQYDSYKFDVLVQDCEKFVLQTRLNYTFTLLLCKPVLGQAILIYEKSGEDTRQERGPRTKAVEPSRGNHW